MSDGTYRAYCACGGELRSESESPHSDDEFVRCASCGREYRYGDVIKAAENHVRSAIDEELGGR